MKHFVILLALAAASTASAADVGVSINIGQPGFYGQLNIGNSPRPQVINAQPVAIERVPMDRPPIYLRVPPGHAKHWRNHCREYNACGERVYFVQDSWYNHEYGQRNQEQHREERRGDQRDQHRDERRDEHRDNVRDH